MSTEMHALLLGSAILPSLVLLGIFYFRDKYPEPPRVVFTTFLLGVLATAPIWGFIVVHGDLVGELQLEPYPKGLYRAFVLAALPEELCKYAILLVYVRRHCAFDEPMDGLVYGASASLGFATLENLIYVDAGGWTTAIARATTAVPLHAMLGAIMGEYVARAKLEPNSRLLHVRALIYPVLLHGMYDAPLLVMEADAEAVSETEVQVFVAFVYVLLGSMVAQVAWNNHRLRRRQRAIE